MRLLSHILGREYNTVLVQEPTLPQLAHGGLLSYGVVRQGGDNVMPTLVELCGRRSWAPTPLGTVFFGFFGSLARPRENTFPCIVAVIASPCPETAFSLQVLRYTPQTPLTTLRLGVRMGRGKSGARRT